MQKLKMTIKAYQFFNNKRLWRRFRPIENQKTLGVEPPQKKSAEVNVLNHRLIEVSRYVMRVQIASWKRG